jgi:hypothetical protein
MFPVVKTHMKVLNMYSVASKLVFAFESVIVTTYDLYEKVKLDKGLCN